MQERHDDAEWLAAPVGNAASLIGKKAMSSKCYKGASKSRTSSRDTSQRTANFVFVIVAFFRLADALRPSCQLFSWQLFGRHKTRTNSPITKITAHQTKHNKS